MKTLMIAAFAVLSGGAFAADTATINRLPYNLDCLDKHRDGSQSTLSLSRMAFYREDGKLYLNADISTSAQDQITSSYIEHLADLIRLEGLEKGSNIKYKLSSINPNDSRLEAGKAYQIKLEIIGAKGDPVDVRCLQ